MKELYESRGAYLVVGVLMAVGVLGGLTMTVLGAVTGQFAVMGVGIGILFLCMIACPLSWTAYGICTAHYKLYVQITDGGVRTVSELAEINGISENAVRRKLTALARKNVIGKNAVDGFYRRGDAGFYAKQTRTCADCGATSEVSPSAPNCPYCNKKLI